MKKILTLFIITVILAAPVLAQTIPTGAYVPPGSGSPPIVKAKWELPDDDTTTPGTQINPPMSYLGTKTVTYWVVVTDPNGKGNVDRAYVDVYHPDGSFKYQVPLTEVDTSTPTKRQNAADKVQDAYDDGILTINTGAGYDLTDVIDEILENSAKVYKGTADLDYHQMCGEYEWEFPCCGAEPYILSGMGYLVRAYAFDQENSKSEFLDNNFEYICMAGLEMDFDSVDFEEVMVCSEKWVEGDWVWDPEGPGTSPACKLGAYCRPPTIRNIGNIPVWVEVTFDDMGFGMSLSEWNVEFDAALKHNEHVYFDPESPTLLPPGPTDPYQDCGPYAVVDLCDTEKISFSIHVKKSDPDMTYEGDALVEPVPLPFPWWQCE